MSKTCRQQPRTRRVFLPAVILLLLGSSLLRLEGGMGFAWAFQEANAEAVSTSSLPTADDESALGVLLARLRAREATVAKQEEALRQKELVLNRLASEVDARLLELEAAEDALRATLALADEAAETDLLQLTTVYENMKPAEAAALFETMEPSFSAGFLGRMKPANAAAIMSGLSPEKAYLISLVLSGRNMNAPKQN